MNFVRWILGKLVLGYDLLTRPKPMERDAAEQQKLDAETQKLALYQFNACPFCVKVRREIRRYALNIELRDARNDEVHKQALIAGGGRQGGGGGAEPHGLRAHHGCPARRAFVVATRECGK